MLVSEKSRLDMDENNFYWTSTSCCWFAWTPQLQEFLAHYDETRPATMEQFQNVWVVDTGQQYNNSLKIHTFYMNLDKLISDRIL